MLEVRYMAGLKERVSLARRMSEVNKPYDRLESAGEPTGTTKGVGGKLHREVKPAGQTQIESR